MNDSTPPQCIAFEGMRCIALGELTHVVPLAKLVIDKGATDAVLLFDADSSARIDVDFQGTLDQVMTRLSRSTRAVSPSVPAAAADATAPRGPGRPKLGVVAREVTLLPRHWDWLNRQPGGASVALRKLVEEARRVNSGKDRVRESQEAAYRFMSPMAGHLPGFEEATRALFAGDASRFEPLTADWPVDVREHAHRLAATALAPLPTL